MRPARSPLVHAHLPGGYVLAGHDLGKREAQEGRPLQRHGGLRLPASPGCARPLLLPRPRGGGHHPPVLRQAGELLRLQDRRTGYRYLEVPDPGARSDGRRSRKDRRLPGEPAGPPVSEDPGDRLPEETGGTVCQRKTKQPADAAL